MQGQFDSELSEVGRRQAKLLARHIQHEHVVSIHTSDLRRAFETAETVGADTEVAVSRDERLRERHFGEAQGETREAFLEMARRASVKPSKFTPPGGETPAQLKARAVDFFKELCVTASYHLRTSSQDPANLLHLNGGASDDLPPSCTCHESSPTEQFFLEVRGGSPPSQGCAWCTTRRREDGNRALKRRLSGSDSSLDQPDSKVSAWPFEMVPDYRGITSASAPPSYSCPPASALLAGAAAEPAAAVIRRSRNASGRSAACPNVSLSPLQQSLYSGASVSSGRRSASDDWQEEEAPAFLVVSHAGLLRELFRYMVSELGCELPTGANVERFSPNTAVSKFCVLLEGEGETGVVPSKLHCIYMHSTEHLSVGQLVTEWDTDNA